MAVEIVTDSLSDITPEFAKELGVTVVPLYVRFGEEVYRDRVEMSTDEFYHKLVHGDTFPTTTQPSPGDFADVYKKLATEDGLTKLYNYVYFMQLLTKELEKSLRYNYPVSLLMIDVDFFIQDND